MLKKIYVQSSSMWLRLLEPYTRVPQWHMCALKRKIGANWCDYKWINNNDSNNDNNKNNK